MRTSRLGRLWHTVWPALLIAVPGLLGTHRAGDDETGWTRAPDLAAEALVALAAVAAVVVRRRPLVTAVGCGCVLVVYFGCGYPTGPVLLALPVAAAGLALELPWRRALWCVGLLWAAVHVAGAVRYLGDAGPRAWLGWLTLTAAMAWTPAAFAAAARVRRIAEAGLRDAAARQAVAEERLRMAQELHDSVGHGLAVIALQAGVALHVMERNPGQARESVTAIQAVSREALHEMRAQVGALRGAEAAHRPAPGLADAAVLLDRLRAGGLAVSVTGELDPAGLPELPDRVDAAAYRILQEALTNVLRHAGATAAQVRVAREDGGLVIEVLDAGPGGSGLAGMRERAEALGGELAAGPRPGGGFGVLARLPLREPS